MKNNEILAEALIKVQEVISKRDDIHILHTSELERKERELLIKRGWLQEIIQGWYLLTRPDALPGDSSAWYASFWDFLAVYLDYFFGEEYCLSAEHSIDLHLDNTKVPKQVIVMAPKGRGSPIELPFNTSLLIYSNTEGLPQERIKVRRLQVMPLPFALCKVSPSFFELQPREGAIALQMVKNSGDLLQVILKHHYLRAAGRLVGGYRFLKNTQMIGALELGLNAAGIPFKEVNPFAHKKPLLTGGMISSPYAARITAMWEEYRETIIENFPEPPGLRLSVQDYLKNVDEQYVQDAYHSLSIEGYQVNNALIEKVKSAEWFPDINEEDRKLSNALAARGYFEAFQSMKKSLAKILNGDNPGEIFEQELAAWYHSLFKPNVDAGLIDHSDLFGYRKFQVYIRNSRHTPLPSHALSDAMNALFSCLKKESHGGVRAILGHFIFVFIHPYMDGNGRIGRLLMNVMLASGGYPWTIVHLEKRKEYLHALEEASVYENIKPFTEFIRSSMRFEKADGDE